MPRKSKTQRLHDIHQEALHRFNDIQSAIIEVRRESREDRRFYSIAGAQWEGQLRDYYDNRPRLEMYKVHLSVMRIINKYRNNRISADIPTEYEDEYDEENDYQQIVINPIFDADTSVFFDLNAKRQDKADAECCFVLKAMTRDAYRNEWGDDPATWPQSLEISTFDWFTPDIIYVAEYYCVEEASETIHIFQNLDGVEERYKDSDFDNDPSLQETLEAIGAVKVNQRRVKARKVHKYIMSGRNHLIVIL